MATQYFFVGDMHDGGDGRLPDCDFELEPIQFLEQLERKRDAEPIIDGDTFGVWGFTTLAGTEKPGTLIEQQPSLFEQFEETGSKIPITIMPRSATCLAYSGMRMTARTTSMRSAGDPAPASPETSRSSIPTVGRMLERFVNRPVYAYMRISVSTASLAPLLARVRPVNLPGFSAGFPFEWFKHCRSVPGCVMPLVLS